LFPADKKNVRRTLYGLVDRQFLPSVLRLFDFANPDLHVPQRSETTVAQQALFAMNHPFLANQARALVADLDMREVADPADRVRQLYRVIYQREPTDAQQQAAQHFVRSASEIPPVSAAHQAWSSPRESIGTTQRLLSPWEQFAQVLLLGNELMFVD
jgi:Protein of unknown function (DUF1553)